MFKHGQHIHLIGIGGTGISAIARILLLRGFSISGSDRSLSPMAAALQADGATVHIGHDAAHVNGADMVITTSAAPPDHVEIVAANAQGIPVYKRQDILAALMADKHVIAVAGTHGKTTTTSMIVHILRENGLDPSYIVGGIMANTGTNAGVGSGRHFVIEADEYDNMFHGLKPNIAVITNIEWDHPDFFKTEADLIESFKGFVDATRANDGMLVVCGDDPIAAQFGRDYAAEGRSVVTYGTQKGAGEYVIARDIITTPENTQFKVDFNTDSGFEIILPLPGRHNVLNATVASAVGYHVSESDFRADMLATFKTTGRRFDLCGEVDGIAIIDDYAHHPTAIKATLQAARARYPEREIWAVWQPHTYSRTAALLDDYAVAFDDADRVIVCDIYAAREAPVPGVDGESTAAALQHPAKQHISGLEIITNHLLEAVTSPAAVIIMSAGDAIAIGKAYMQRKSPRRNGASDVDSSS